MGCVRLREVAKKYFKDSLTMTKHTTKLRLWREMTNRRTKKRGETRLLRLLAESLGRQPPGDDDGQADDFGDGGNDDDDSDDDNDGDEGYGGDDVSSDPGWAGDGRPQVQGGDDEGYSSNDDEGFYEASEAGTEGESVGETVVISTEEEAAALAASEGTTAFGGSTVTAGSFLAFIWYGISNGRGVSAVNSIPSESIQMMTKTKTESTPTTTTSTSSSCPTSTGIPVCQR